MAKVQIPPQAKDLAHTVVSRVAPEELVLFDQIWNDFIANPDVSRPVGGAVPAPGPQGGDFGNATMVLLSTIIIPVVVKVLSDKAAAGLDKVIQHVRSLISARKAKQPTATPDEQQVQQIAETTVQVVKTDEPAAGRNQ